MAIPPFGSPPPPKLIDQLKDVDTTTTPPTLSDTLKWNGANWVPAVYNYNFTYSFDSTACSVSTAQLIGSGNWKTTGNLSYTLAYTNGPPDSAYVDIGGTAGVTWASRLNLSSPYTNVNSGENTGYPSSKGTYIRFTGIATKSTATQARAATDIYFYNNTCYGTTTKTSGYNSGDVTGLAGTTLQNSGTISGKTINPGASTYILYAYPANFADINATGFTFLGMTMGVQSLETVSVTNANGFVENYKVYRSTSANMGSSSFSASTSSALVNELHYGASIVTTGWTSAQIQAFAGMTISNTHTGTVGTINSTASLYAAYAVPTRLSVLTTSGFLFNSIRCPFQSPETISVTNDAGYVENYSVYRSTNYGLGNYTLQTSTSDTTIDPIYYGVSTKASGYTEGDIEGLATSVVSNTKGRTIVVTAAAGEYIMYSLPTRLGTVSFNVGGFDGGFESPETVSVTNANGYAENYYIYRSTNSGLGATTVVIT